MKFPFNVEIITIGDELLIGQVIDTNSAWIGQQLNEIGLRVHRINSISDRSDEILDALKGSESRSDVVLITGGLGPTKDDITKKCLCEYFNCGLTFDQASFENVKRIFAARGKEVTPLNRTQAELPSICEPLLNMLGTAPGMWFDHNGKVFISMPGVPYEMKGLMKEHVIPRLQARFKLPPVLHRTILTQGIGESMIADMIGDWEDELPAEIKLAYLPSPGLVRLRLTASGNDEDLLKNELNRLSSELTEKLEEYVFGYDDDTLEELIGTLLRKSGKTLATAESCTGGYIAHRITSIPGSSDYFMGSVIAYDNAVKSAVLQVPNDLLAKHGAVSREVVEAMAVSVKRLLQTDYAVATSGVAGPGGGTTEKPVGTVHIAIADPYGVYSHQLRLGDNRDRNIRETMLHALNLLRKKLLSGS
ncbi:MAG: competence/damage-inducible protein A [Bacteroidota bacterium]